MGTHPIFESDFDCLTEMPAEMLATVGVKQGYNEGVLVGNWVENRARRNYKNGNLEKLLTNRSSYQDDYLSKQVEVERNSRQTALDAKMGNVKVRGMETVPITTSYNLEFSPRKNVGNRDWRMIRNSWFPEASDRDNRIKNGTHQNWGLKERTESKLKATPDQNISDYSQNFINWRLGRQTIPRSLNSDYPSVITYDLNNTLSNMRLRNQRIMLCPDSRRPWAKLQKS